MDDLATVVDSAFELIGERNIRQGTRIHPDVKDLALRLVQYDIPREVVAAKTGVSTASIHAWVLVLKARDEYGIDQEQVAADYVVVDHPEFRTLLEEIIFDPIVERISTLYERRSSVYRIMIRVFDDLEEPDWRGLARKGFYENLGESLEHAKDAARDYALLTHYLEDVRAMLEGILYPESLSVVTEYYGLDGKEGRTFEAIASSTGKSRNRVGNIKDSLPRTIKENPAAMSMLVFFRECVEREGYGLLT